MTTDTAIHDEPHDEHGAHAAHAHTPEEIRREMRVYLMVFGALAVLTGVTVGVCYGFDLPVHYAIMVAMAVAIVKGTLVACFFMHLISERKLILSILAVTVFFFGVLIWLPLHHYIDRLK
jgi:cytochrome c oxidase subunit 4